MERRDSRELGPRAGSKPVEGDDPREKLGDRSGQSGPFPRADRPRVDQKEVVKNRDLEPSEDFARRGNIETERPDQEGPLPDHGGGDEESGRPVLLGGQKPMSRKPTTETRR